MSWKTQVGIDGMHPAFTERYMDDHDLCECERCHDRGDHDNLLEWKDACRACDEENSKIDHENGEHDRPFHHYSRCAICFEAIKGIPFYAAFEFTFTIGDVKTAEEWAKRNGYRYDEQSHLLHDAMEAGAIRPRTWKAA